MKDAELAKAIEREVEAQRRYHEALRKMGDSIVELTESIQGAVDLIKRQAEFIRDHHKGSLDKLPGEVSKDAQAKG